jgi:murein DD-endopeptidase MepM/ murein hydrolase activator NlpD
VYGQPLYAVAAGVVVDSGDLGGSSYGCFLTIAHSVAGEVFDTMYAHLLRGSVAAQAGDHVSVGQVIGLIGSTGVSTGPHLHFEVHVSGAPIDPLPWLAARASGPESPLP